MLRTCYPLLASLRLAAPGAGAIRQVHASGPSFKASADQVHVQEETSVSSAVLGDSKIGHLLARLRFKQQQQLLCSSDESVLEAVTKMAKANVGSLMVFDAAAAKASGADSADSIVGIVTERDYLTKVVVEGRSSQTTLVSSIMTPRRQLRVLTPEHSVMEAMELMADSNIRHVPVMENNLLVGMVSVRDVVKSIVEEYRVESNHLRDYIHGTTY